MGTRDRLSSWCSACHLARTREWLALNRDEVNQRRRDRASDLRAERIAEGGAEILALVREGSKR
jgi:hypothetical protein